MRPRLLPPRPGPPGPAGAPAAPDLPRDRAVAAFASVAIGVSALLDWTTATTAFGFPARVLADPGATAGQPRLGMLLVALGLLGLVIALARPGATGRIVTGALAAGIAVLFWWRVAGGLGLGPVLAGVAGVVLATSPLLRPRR
jgi:hypothetical protein